MAADSDCARTISPPEAAISAERNAAADWRRRYLEWLESGRAGSSAGLLRRLPLQDAVTLAALVGTGRVTWAEINAALDAMLKRSVANALDDELDGHSGPPAPPSGRRTAEDEIWARYHAQCDEVFADESLPMDKASWTPAQLWRTRQVLDRLRDARDRELTAMRRRLDTQPSVTASSEIRLTPSRVAQTELSPAERAALDRLDATGFIASAVMIATIDDVVGEIGGTLGSGA